MPLQKSTASDRVDERTDEEKLQWTAIRGGFFDTMGV
jgi:hypothetical protein